ncbi:unnamed protein product, partial [Rhizoctonia solani]
AASAAVLEATRGTGGKGADVGAEEEARLKSTDRYGFFVNPTPKHEGRLALLPALPLKTFASPHKPVSIPLPTDIPSLPPISRVPPPTVSPRENTRIGKWERMLVPAASGGSGGEGWKWNPLKLKKRTERVFKGIPDRWRSAAWGTLVEEKTARTRERRLSVNQLRVQYRDLLDAPSEHDVQIDLDVPRTISGHVLFHTRYGQGQRSLFYVLHAFSQLCPSCGYVQGMGPIAATLLNYFEPERTYAILVRLHDEYEMHTIFQPGFPGLLENIYVQERLIERIMPGVYQALANFETILSLLSSTFVFEDEDGLFRWMEKLLSDTRLRAEMDTWRVEWARLVAEGKSGKALL